MFCQFQIHVRHLTVNDSQGVFINIRAQQLVIPIPVSGLLGQLFQEFVCGPFPEYLIDGNTLENFIQRLAMYELHNDKRSYTGKDVFFCSAPCHDLRYWNTGFLVKVFHDCHLVTHFGVSMHHRTGYRKAHHPFSLDAFFLVKFHYGHNVSHAIFGHLVSQRAYREISGIDLRLHLDKQ